MTEPLSNIIKIRRLEAQIAELQAAKRFKYKFAIRSREKAIAFLKENPRLYYTWTQLEHDFGFNPLTIFS